MNELRIDGGVDRAVWTHIDLDGERVRAAAGESVAAALLAAGFRTLGRDFRTGMPRGAFCFMGLCQECLIMIDGAPAQACLTEVREGMRLSLNRP